MVFDEVLDKEVQLWQLWLRVWHLWEHLRPQTIVYGSQTQSLQLFWHY